MARPHIEPYVEQSADYKAFDLPGFTGGSHYKVLSMDADTGACSLTMRFDAGYRRDAFVSTNAHLDAPWLGVARRDPGVASGFAVKYLRMDPATKANTFLYAAIPEFIQDNISYHDCAEEAFDIQGDCSMMQFGELPTGGYAQAGVQTLYNCNVFAFENGVISDMILYYANPQPAQRNEPTAQRPTGYPRT